MAVRSVGWLQIFGVTQKCSDYSLNDVTALASSYVPIAKSHEIFYQLHAIADRGEGGIKMTQYHNNISISEMYTMERNYN